MHLYNPPSSVALVLRVQNKIDAVYKDQKKWTHMSIMSTAGMGKFSTDRTIDEYAKVRGRLRGLS
jgi:starch phosphorylase